MHVDILFVLFAGFLDIRVALGGQFLGKSVAVDRISGCIGALMFGGFFDVRGAGRCSVSDLLTEGFETRIPVLIDLEFDDLSVVRGLAFACTCLGGFAWRHCVCWCVVVVSRKKVD